MQLNDVVLSTIQDFVNNNVLFTALDVSNKVKEVLPFARHREVRDLVRALFTTDIEPANYAKTPIQVTLANGDTVEALLYHPLADSWDLDSKYDNQKRNQTALRPGGNVPAPIPVAPWVAGGVSAGIAVPTPAPVSQPTNPVVSPVPVPAKSLPAAAQWQSLFNGALSLFPRKP